MRRHRTASFGPLLIHRQILLLQSKNHQIKPIIKRTRAHPMRILPNPSHHHRDRPQVNRIPLNPTTSQVLTAIATSLSSRIRSNNPLGTHRLKHPGINRCYHRWQHSPPQHRYRLLRVDTTGQTPCDRDR